MDNIVRTEWHWIKSRVRRLWKRRRLSFITIHYLYMIGLSIAGSILLFPAGGVPYIDALFFASGATTQSGLNTIDLNKLTLYQQIVLYFIAMVANPIVINTAVVFVRLYWFEKRFQYVVKEATSLRRTRTRSRTNTQGMEEKSSGTEERGVNGRRIVVLHGAGKSVGPGMNTVSVPNPKVHPKVEHSSDSSDAQNASSDLSETSELDLSSPRPMEHPPSFHRNITFADELVLPTELSAEDRLPQRLSPEQHIAFLENQRNPRDKGTLRIPGPREFDRGQGPETLNEDPPESAGGLFGEDPMRRDISLEDSVRPDLHKMASSLSKLNFQRIASSRSKGQRGLDQTPTRISTKARSGPISNLPQAASRDKDSVPYLSWQPTIGRNSAFVDLTEEQREELGGIEYRSLKLLALILVSYFLLWHLLGVVLLLPWIIRTDTWGTVVDEDGINRPWWGIFTSATLFNDLGFTLTPDSMISFQGAVLPLLLGSFLIIIGNTGFPCMLRFIIWIGGKVVPEQFSLWEEIRFLLDHPRRCFTLLFPSSATWVLFGILVLLNGIDLIFFIALDLNDPAVTLIDPPGLRVLNGLFQAASTRTAGTAVVNLANLHPGIQVSYLIMMYISVFPIAISVRRTNVYEEKSLGIYGSAEEDEEDEKEPSYIGAHLRRQLSFDLWFIFLGLFIVAIAEGPRLQDPNDVAFSMFACLFEIVSAYGTVGLSLGYPTINASFSAEFTVVSKLVVIAMMIRGRHRGLPYELDRAILLPSESLHKKEDEDAAKRIGRRLSNVGDIDTVRATLAGASERSPQNDLLSPRSIINSQHSIEHGHLQPHPVSGLGRMMAGIARKDMHMRSDHL